jgi:hypothetical protein
MYHDLLKQLIRNTMLKDSFQLILSGNTSEFTIRIDAPINLPDGPSVNDTAHTFRLHKINEILKILETERDKR